MKFTLKIKKNGTFRYILNNGKYASGKYLSVHITSNNSKKYKDKNFIGICISKKNGNSVQRNKMKRWVREVYKNKEKGVSTILINTEKGSLFINDIIDQFDYEERDVMESVNGNTQLRHPIDNNEASKKFKIDYLKHGFKKAYLKQTLLIRFKRKISKVKRKVKKLMFSGKK